MRSGPIRIRSAILGILALTLACASAPAGGPAVGSRVEITVLGTTDVHGRLLPWDYYTGETTDRGLARVATLVDSIRQTDPDVVLVDSGDLLQGNPLDTYYGVVQPADVHPVIRAMNLLGYDAAAVGNHEFNYGIPALRRALSKADFPLLAGNVTVAGTDSLAWPAFTVIERDGVRIGILGLTTPGSAIWDRANVEGRLEFRDMVASARRAWPALERASDVQIAIVHTGLGPGSSYDESATGVPPENAGRALAEALPGLDLILLGHSHVNIPSKTVNGVLMAQAGRWADHLAVAKLDVERTAGGWTVVDRSATTLATKGVPPDSAFTAAIEPYHERVVAWVADTIGWTPDRWSTAGARLEDKPILDLVQAVQMNATGADLSAASAFTDDARMGPGPITIADAAGLYVYDNTLKSVRITGRQLKEYLEYSAKYFHRTTPDGTLIDAGGDDDLAVDSVPGYNYDVVAGVDYDVDVTRPVGDRIRNLTYHGAPVPDDRTFTMAINNYRQGGGGGFSMIAGAPVVYDRQESVRQLVIDWIAARDTIRAADVFQPSWRIVPPAVATRWLADTAPAAPADSARLAEITEREARRIASDARARVEVRTPPGLASLPPPIPAGADSIRIAIVATNDIHGALEPMTPSWAHGDTIGGAAVLAGWIRGIEARYPGTALWIDAGDEMQGTLISNLTAGRSTVDVLNRIGLDAAAVGNHEFDWGVDTLVSRMAQARYPWLVANLFDRATGKRPAWARPVAWLRAGGLRIAVIGVATVSTPVTTMPINVAPYEFRDIAETVNAIAPALKREGADLVVVTAHAGAIAEEGSDDYRGEIVDAARRITAPVDLIVSGHTHTLVNTVVNGIPIIQARSSGTAVGLVTLTYDRRAGRVVSHTIHVWTTRAAEVDPAPDIARAVGGYADRVREIAERSIATLAVPLERDRGRETALGDLIADAQRAATGAQIAAVNGGGIRADLKAGPVAYADVFRVQPFQNVLVNVVLTGAQLKAFLEGVVSDRLGQVSGVRFTFDPTRPAGSRVVDATLEDDGTPLLRDGKPVDPDATYRVTVNNFMASGGDDYAVLKDAVESTSTGLVDSDVLAEYLSSRPQPIHPGTHGRMTALAPWPAE